MKHVQSQESFAALDVAQGLKDEWAHKFVNHEAFSGIVLDKKSSNSDQEDMGAILDSWNAYIAFEILRPQDDTDIKPGVCWPTSTEYIESIFEPLKRMDNPVPPSRFRRRGAMWKTMTSRVLEHAIEPATLH